MSKKDKPVQPAQPVTTVAAVAAAKPPKKGKAKEVAAPVAAPVAKLTKRNATPTGTTLVLGDKKMALRADHNKAAWEAVAKVLPATAAAIVALPDLGAAHKNPARFVSYLLRRQYLKQA